MNRNHSSQQAHEGQLAAIMADLFCSHEAGFEAAFSDRKDTMRYK